MADEAMQAELERLKAENEALRGDNERLRAALEFQRQVAVETELAVVLEKTLVAAFEMFKADNAAILLKGTDNRLHLEAVRRRAAEESEDDAVLLPASLLERVMASKEGVVTAEAIADDRSVASRGVTARRIRSAMAVPLISEGDVLGALFLGARERTGAFTDKDLRIFSAIVSPAAWALERTELRHRG